MRHSVAWLAAVVLLLALLLAFPVSARDNTRPVRVGYLESEPYNQFTYELTGIARGLENLGILHGLPDLTGEEDARAVWQTLCEGQLSPLVRFEPEAFYSMPELSGDALAAAVSGEKTDLLLVMGTVAGVYLTRNSANVDYMVFASGDPISAGIVKSETERVNNRSFAHIDQSRYVRQIQAAYNLLHFQDIGVVYQDTPQAASYSGISQLERAAGVFGFQIHTLHVNEPASAEDYDRYYRELKAAYRALLPDIDALYITTASIQDEKLPWLLEEAHQAGVYTIAQSSERQVKFGALMNVSINNPDEEGLFGAQRLFDYLTGTPVSQLAQGFESTPKLALNFSTAQALRLKLPFRSLLIFDTIYTGGNASEE